jgi:hypothetical protein
MRTTIIALLLLAAPVTAYAQVVFPPDSEYRPLRCGNEVSIDALGDDPDFLLDRDLVGNPTSPSALRASDATNLYLRIRLEENPVQNNGQLPLFSWGMEFDLDDDLTDYELLILVDGIADPAGTVSVFRNTATTMQNSPNDPADQPAAQTYTFAMNARVIVAGSQFGADDDYFLDFAVPWSALIPLGLDRDTPTRVWVASSSSANSLNGDFACHVGGGGGPPPLPDADTDPTTGDPNDPGANGGEGRLEGGGGCATGGGAGLLLGLLALGLLRRR